MLVFLNKRLTAIERTKNTICGIVIFVVNAYGACCRGGYGCRCFVGFFNSKMWGKDKFALVSMEHLRTISGNIFLDGIEIFTNFGVVILDGFLGNVFDGATNRSGFKLMTTPVTAVLEIFNVFTGFKVNHGNMALIETFGFIQERNDVDMFVIQFRKFSQFGGILGGGFVDIGNIRDDGDAVFLFNFLRVNVVEGKDVLFTFSLFLDDGSVDHYRYVLFL
jgi:hypothetical protein